MKRLAAIVCLLVACVNAQAQASTASIEKLLVITNVEKLLTTMQQQMDNMMKAGMDHAFAGKKLAPEARQMADRLNAKMMAHFREELSWERMKDLYIQVYGESFTQEEIDGLIAFYESPVGKAFVAKTPAVMQRTMVLMQQRMGPIMEKMQKSIEDVTREVESLQPKAG